MQEKNTFEDNVISEIKSIIISDSSLSYSERKSLDKIIARINNGDEFKEAIAPSLRHFADIKNHLNDEDISENLNVLFEKVTQKYDIPPKKERTYFYAGAGSGKRQNFISMGIGIIVIFALYVLVTYFLKKFNIN